MESTCLIMIIYNYLACPGVRISGRDRVRTAVEQGLVRTEEFTGAFRKQTRARVAVMRAQAPGAAGAWDADPGDAER